MALEFRRTLSRLLCRVAIDDFGRGHNVLSDVVTLAPDVIKIDAIFLQQAFKRDGRVVLTRLAGLCGSLARDVVVEGVASGAAEALAADAGAPWMQGNFLAGPAMTLLADDEICPDRIDATDMPILWEKPVMTLPRRRWPLIVGMTALCWIVIGLGGWAIVT